MSEERTAESQELDQPTPPAAPDTTAPEPQPAPPPAPPAENEPAAPPPPPEPPKAATDWRDRRIAQLTAQLHAERAKNQQPSAAPPAGEDVEARIAREVEARAAANDFARRCNEVAEAGRQSFPDFDARVGQLTRMVDSNDPQQVGQYNSFLSAALETGEAAKIIHALGGDLNEAGRIMALPPQRQAVELTKMALRPSTEPSQAPKPINPVATVPSNRSPIAPDDPERSDTLPIEEFMRRREIQVRERGLQ